MLGHNRQGEIMAIAALVIGLEVVAVNSDDRAVWQIAEGAADRIRARVTDQGQDQARFQSSLRVSDQVNLTTMDRYSLWVREREDPCQGKKAGGRERAWPQAEQTNYTKARHRSAMRLAPLG